MYAIRQSTNLETVLESFLSTTVAAAQVGFCEDYLEKYAPLRGTGVVPRECGDADLRDDTTPCNCEIGISFAKIVTLASTLSMPQYLLTTDSSKKGCEHLEGLHSFLGSFD